MAWDLPLTDFNIRWYHVYSTIAFLVANLWNFQLNRLWTFRSARHSGWLREYLPFLTVGLLAQIVGLGILTLLMHPGSPFSLSPAFFDDSTGFRTRLYWAQLITIASSPRSRSCSTRSGPSPPSAGTRTAVAEVGIGAHRQRVVDRRRRHA